MESTFRPIGVIHSPFTDKANTPIQPSRSRAAGTVEVFPEFADGLADLDGFSHIILLYAFHQSEGYSLRVQPFLDNAERGLFATRYPCRPNPLGLSIVRLTARRDNAHHRRRGRAGRHAAVGYQTLRAGFRRPSGGARRLV